MSRIALFRFLSVGVLSVWGASTAPGCETEEAPVEQRLCERFDACNYFSAGLDVDDCTDVMTMCGDSLVRSRREDWVADAEDALGRNNCGNFLETYQQASACTISPTGTVSNGGGPTSIPGGRASDGPTDASSGGAAPTDPPPQDACTEDIFSCTDANVISGCLDGEPFSLSCDIVCDELPSDGCRYDEEAESDLCICLVEEDPEPAPDPPGPAPGE